MQIGVLGYPGIALTGPQITRCLEAYLIWLFGKVMFTETHVDTISARFIPIAREIAEAESCDDIVPRSFGSAVLASTYRALCTTCTKNKESSSILGCPLLLHLWSWERLPVGRPDIDGQTPWDEYRLIDANDVDLPTVGTVWARREVRLYHSYTFDLVTNYFHSLTCLPICREGTRASKSKIATCHSRCNLINCKTIRLYGSHTILRGSLKDTRTEFPACAKEIGTIG